MITDSEKKRRLVQVAEERARLIGTLVVYQRPLGSLSRGFIKDVRLSNIWEVEVEWCELLPYAVVRFKKWVPASNVFRLVLEDIGIP